nr:MAG TPA_asm: hypothetical protein [Caudoviricetes sp.]
MAKGFTNSIIGGAGEGLYVWKKSSIAYSEKQKSSVSKTYISETPTNKQITYYTATSYTFDEDTGLFTLVNPTPHTLNYKSSVGINASLYATALSPNSEIMIKATSSDNNTRINNGTDGLYFYPVVETSEYLYFSYTKEINPTFLSYITSDSILSYPLNGQKGDYWYELVQSNVDWGEVTLTTATTEITVNHNLGEVPKWAGIFPNEKAQGWSEGTSYATVLALIEGGTTWQQVRGASLYYESKAPILSNSSITFDQSYNFYPLTYYWFALGSPKSLLSILSWQQIGDLVLKAEQGTVNLSDYFSIGDTKPVTLTTGETIELQIAGFNHDTFSDGVTAPVTFVMKDCLNTKAQMNGSNTNTGGYPDSAMKIWVENNIYDKLPSELKALVAPVKKKWYTTYNNVNSLTEGNYNVWLLSEAEVFDSVTQTIGSGEGTKYPIFTDNASRIKKVNGTNDLWWLGSCYRSGSDPFVVVRSGGGASGYSASYSGGVAAGLCIRKQSGDL